MFLYPFDMSLLKIFLKNKKKYYFNIFLNKKYFKNQSRSELLKYSGSKPLLPSYGIFSI